MITVETAHPIAADSNDHIVPRGTKADNTHHPQFVNACQQHFGGPIKYLDIGCSGGGLVKDFFDAGHFAVGIEGSDYSKRIKRAEWATIPGNLFTADITKPWAVKVSGHPVTFQVITAWEVLEHIAEEDLPGLFEMIKRHMEPGSIFVGSISMFSDEHEGVEYHRTIRPFDWWGRTLLRNGLPSVERQFLKYEDMPRGTGLNGDFNFAKFPHYGCHFCVEMR